MKQPLSNIYAVTMTVHHDDDGVRLVADNDLSFVVAKNDEIHMVRGLSDGESLALLFQLGDEFGEKARISGFSFGHTSNDALENAPMLDTLGRFYPETPFTLSAEPAHPGAAAVTVKQGAEARRFKWDSFFFDIWISNSAIDHRIDPKIYNKGDHP